MTPAQRNAELLRTIRETGDKFTPERRQLARESARLLRTAVYVGFVSLAIFVTHTVVSIVKALATNPPVCVERAP